MTAPGRPAPTVTLPAAMLDRLRGRVLELEARNRQAELELRRAQAELLERDRERSEERAETEHIIERLYDALHELDGYRGRALDAEAQLEAAEDARAQDQLEREQDEQLEAAWRAEAEVMDQDPFVLRVVIPHNATNPGSRP